MTIKIGDKIPSINLKRLGEGGMEDFNIADYIAKKKVVIFAVPGAFTPACSQKHLPGYIEKAKDIKAKGVDEIICIAVNDPS
jgi:peroxiredoxin